MASSTTERFQPDVKFIGPSDLTFKSSQEQSEYFLDTHLTRWNDYEQPRSYIIPSTFTYKHADVSDQEVTVFREKLEQENPGKQHYLITDRISDKAKHAVFTALEILSQENRFGPFLVFRRPDLRLNYVANELRGPLVTIFPQLNWAKYEILMEEAFGRPRPGTAFDFLIIGPKIGIALIEVLASRFKNPKEFQHRNRDSMPETYKDSLDRLKAIKPFLFLVREITGIEMPDERCVKRISFCPHLDKSKFDNWVQSLNEEGQKSVQTRLDRVTQLFSDDAVGEKPLYPPLLALFENANPISVEMYEEYAKAITTISFANVIKKTGECPKVDLSKTGFSPTETSKKKGSPGISTQISTESVDRTRL